MSAKIPESMHDLLDTNYVTLATVMPNGQPQLSIVWCSYDGEYILVNTAQGRQKEKNMAARPMATVMCMDPQNPFRWLEVRGTVEEVTTKGALEHINELAKAYRGYDSFYGHAVPAEQQETETRIICKIKPTRVVVFE
ncbi:MAG: PPOX class F420-dependent oxidoreductase [Chloroflexota bacterium]